MRVLADTHAVLWWLGNDPRLSTEAHSIFRDGSNQVFWSLVSSFEVAVKISVGKLRLGKPLERFFATLVHEQGFTLLPISNAHCVEYSSIPLEHRDPFDRMLVAQARSEHLPLLSADPKLASYEIELIW